MTALSDNRVGSFQFDTEAVPQTLSYRVKGSTTIYAGALVALTSGGYVAGATATTGLIAVGRADEKVVNSGADGAKRIKIRQGVFAWNNATSTDACAVTDVGKDVYILDDNTVTITASGHSKAGKLVDILANGQCLVLTGLGVV